MLYTTAADVLPLVAAAPPPLQALGVGVGHIYQRFTAEGCVQNVVRLKAGPLLESDAGATFIVDARWTLVKGRTISLHFLRARLGGLRLSALGEALLAPALLPRGRWTLDALQAARAAELSVPLGVSERQAFNWVFKHSQS